MKPRTIGIFFDRDGAINTEIDFHWKPEELKLIPKAVDALRESDASNLKVFTVTNQSSITPRIPAEDGLAAVNKRVIGLLKRTTSSIITMMLGYRSMAYGTVRMSPWIDSREFQKGSLALKSYKMLIVTFVVFILTLGGCMENPTSVGIGLLSSGTKPSLQIDTLPASSYSTVATTIYTSSSDRLLLGKYPGYIAISILRFTGLPAGALDTVTIVGSYIKLHSVYHFGDAVAPIAFLGYPMIANSDSASYDSLTTLPGNYYSPSTMLAYQPTFVDDTSTIQCSVDTGIVHNWFTTAGSGTNYGIILIPTNVTTIKGFASFVNGTSSYWPTLVVDYTKNGVSGSVSYSSGVSRFVANINQTALVSSDPQSMFVQSGVAYRAQLEFNLRSLPKAGLILKADLELTFNPLQSNLNSFAADTLYSYFVNKDSTIAPLPPEGQTIITNGNKIYRFAIGDFVRSWANGDTLQRLQFGGLRETSSLDLFALYGTLSSSGLRPRLIYTFIVQ